MSPEFRPLTAGAGVEVLAGLEALDLREPPPAGGLRAVGVLVSSADGRVTVDGRAGGLGSPTDRAVLRGLRALCDCVLVGTGTLNGERYGQMLDAEQLEHREAHGLPRKPLVATVSRSLSLDPDVPLLGEDDARVRIYTDAEGDLGDLAADVAVVRPAGGASVRTALEDLRGLGGVALVSCEGGPTLLAELVREGLLTDLVLTLAPKLVGGREPLTLIEGDLFDEPVEMDLEAMWRDGSHLYLHYRIAPADAQD